MINTYKKNHKYAGHSNNYKNCDSCFKRERLPAAGEYYRSQGLALKGGSEWKSTLCVFHEDTKPSLYIRLDTGFFCCKACGARGGDIIAFHRKRYNLGFVDAVRSLGAWEQKYGK